MKEKKTLTEQEKKSKKEKIFFSLALVAILVISILTANVNMLDEITGFVKKIWNDSQEAVAESEQVKTVSKGAHITIQNTQVIHLREIYEVMGEEIDEEQAIAILQEVKVLAYHGKRIGMAASSKEIKSCISDLKKKLKNADEAQYRKVYKRYGDEDDYWNILESEIEEYVISEKMRAEKREEFKQKKKEDPQKELQEYIDEIVGYESFQ